jgi:hypothetical protein
MNMEHVVKAGPAVVVIERQHNDRDWLCSFQGEPVRLIIDSAKNGRVIARRLDGRMESCPVKLS